ncbi:hypothetical protein LIER_36193 [Lithospermum erythrorhizon]|uniref:Transposase n=1 Tax=Lithospermum erythrorhizon TaxID=34254 RepID=A0AAV3P422_LITER
MDDMGPILNDIGPLPKSRFEHSDQLMSAEEDESESKVCSSVRQRKRNAGIESNSEVHLKHSVLVPNMVFGSAQDFRKLIREYVVGKSTELSIKTLVGNHTCCTSMKIPMVSVKWLARKYVNKVRRNPKFL